jgi:hypothetical protein
MTKGQKIEVTGFDGETAECRLYGIEGKIALVCSEQEWQRASAERRAPDCLGWPLAYVKDSNSKPLAVIDQSVRRNTRQSRISQ